MATRIWTAAAPAVNQVDTLTVGGTIETDDRFIVTLTGEAGETETLNVAAGSTVAADVAAAIAAAAALLNTPLFSAVNWSADGADVVAQAKVAGVPFYCAVSTTEAGGGAADSQTFTRTATTANSGPCDWNVADNWSEATKPTTGDIVYIENCATDILYGMNQAAVTLAALHIRQSFLGRLGLPNAYLRIQASAVRIGEHYGATTPAGSPRIKLQLGTVKTDIFVYNSARYAAEPNLPPIRLLATHANSTMVIQRGRVGIACENSAETSQINSLTVGYVANQAADADVVCGPGLIINSVSHYGGSTTVQSSLESAIVYGGALTLAGSGDVESLVCMGGTTYCQTTGTIASLEITGGTADFDRCAVNRTVTQLSLYTTGTGKIKNTTSKTLFLTVQMTLPKEIYW